MKMQTTEWEDTSIRNTTVSSFPLNFPPNKFALISKHVVRSSSKVS